jgi:hypothetical protein
MMVLRALPPSSAPSSIKRTRGVPSGTTGEHPRQSWRGGAPCVGPGPPRGVLAGRLPRWLLVPALTVLEVRARLTGLLCPANSPPAVRLPAAIPSRIPRILLRCAVSTAQVVPAGPWRWAGRGAGGRHPWELVASGREPSSAPAHACQQTTCAARSRKFEANRVVACHGSIRSPFVITSVVILGERRSNLSDLLLAVRARLRTADAAGLLPPQPEARGSVCLP